MQQGQSKFSHAGVRHMCSMCISLHSLSLISIWWSWQPQGTMNSSKKYINIHLNPSNYCRDSLARTRNARSNWTIITGVVLLWWATLRDGIYALLKFYLPWAVGLLSDWCTFWNCMHVQQKRWSLFSFIARNTKWNHFDGASQGISPRWPLPMCVVEVNKVEQETI